MSNSKDSHAIRLFFQYGKGHDIVHFFSQTQLHPHTTEGSHLGRATLALKVPTVIKADLPRRLSPAVPALFPAVTSLQQVETIRDSARAHLPDALPMPPSTVAWP